MFEIFGISSQLLFSQLLLGLINGAFYAMLSLGLAVIFGMLNVINFTHGAQYMMGAFAAWLLLGILDVPFWFALVLSPLIVGLFGVVLERLMLKRIYHLDHPYGSLSFIVKVLGLTALNSATKSMSLRPIASRLPQRWIEGMQSSDVTGVPSLQSSPSRRVMV